MARRTKHPVSRDPYWEVVQSLMQDITYCYEQYREKKPVLLFDIQENRIYVYPYLEFKNDLSERSQRSLQEQVPLSGSAGLWASLAHLSVGIHGEYAEVVVRYLQV